MSVVKKPHYNSRFLTEPWEVRDRRLKVYDFEAKRLRPNASSRSLFAKPGINSSDSDRLMSKAFENPVAQYRARGGQVPGHLGPIKDYAEYRALLALFVMQPARIGMALVPQYEGITVDALLAQGEVVFDQAYTLLNPDNEVISYNLPTRERLFFPETGFFVVPVLRHPPVLAIPMTPRSCIILRPRTVPDEVITDWCRIREAFSAFSVGVGGHAKRVVIPPDVAIADEYLPEVVEKLRRDARDHFNRTGKRNIELGFKGWNAD